MNTNTLDVFIELIEENKSPNNYTQSKLLLVYGTLVMFIGDRNNLNEANEAYDYVIRKLSAQAIQWLVLLALGLILESRTT